MKDIKKILIIGGGTGGHIFPGISIAHSISKKGWIVQWIGSYETMESYLVPKNNIKINFIKVKPIRGKKIKEKIQSILLCFQALLKVIKILNKFRPDIVLCMGGYVSGPGGLAAWIKKIPLIVHEQNSIIGLTNLVLSKISSKNLQAFPHVIKHAVTVGNPISEGILRIPDPIKRLKERFGPIRILVLGGSQGSETINNIFPKIVNNLSKKVKILHQVGKVSLRKTLRNYKNICINNNYRIIGFIDNIASAYYWADIVICRSGALTVSEISCVGIAAIFIPITSDDNHQYLNAKILEDAGAAIIIQQKELKDINLIKILKKLTRKKLLLMAKKAKLQSQPKSTEYIVKEIVNLS